jgi:hypothetical protein
MSRRGAEAQLFFKIAGIDKGFLMATGSFTLNAIGDEKALPDCIGRD